MITQQVLLYMAKSDSIAIYINVMLDRKKGKFCLDECVVVKIKSILRMNLSRKSHVIVTQVLCLSTFS